LQNTQAQIAEKDLEIFKLEIDDLERSRQYEREVQELRIKVEESKIELNRARIGLELLKQMEELEEELEKDAAEKRANMTTCQTCGAVNHPSARFCVNCGHVLNENKEN